MNFFLLQIKNLSNENPQIVQNSLEKLEIDLKNAYKAHQAIKLGIFEKLFLKIQENSSAESSEILSIALKILNHIARDYKFSSCIAENAELIKLILTIMKPENPQLLDTCAEIFQTLSDNPEGKNTNKPF